MTESPAMGVTATTEGSTGGVSLRDYSLILAIVLICAFFAALSPKFVGARNLSNLAVELSITAVLALGMLLIIITGNIDLSVGSGVGLFGGAAAVLLFEQGWPAPAAMLLPLVAAVAVYLAMGSLIVVERIPAFIITLAGWLVFRGVQWKVIHNSTIPVMRGSAENLYSLLTTWYVPPVAGWVLAALAIAAMGIGLLRTRRRRLEFGMPVQPADLAFAGFFIQAQLIALFVLICNQYRGIPLPAVILGLTAFVIWVLTEHTRFGRYLYAIGGNEEAAVVSGIPVRKVVIGAFGIMGFIVALGGFLQTAYAGASTTTTGQLLEMDAIAACVIGGTSLKGGRGAVSGVLFGSLIMASLLNGMTLMAVAPEAKYVARGLVLALAVWMDVRLGRKG